LILAFETDALRTLCQYQEEATSAFGSVVASALRTRLADLRAASRITDIPTYVPQPRSGTEECTVDLPEGYSLVFRANHVSNPTLPDGSTDWGRVDRIRLIIIVAPLNTTVAYA